MKKVVLVFFSIYLLVIAVTPNYDVEELGKIPYLVQHYSNHKSNEANTSLLEFIFNHINVSNHNETDHQDLPFQNHQLPNLYPVILTNCFSIIKTNPILITTKVLFVYNIGKSTTPANSVWQPPKA